MRDVNLIACFWHNNLTTVEKTTVLARAIESVVHEISKDFYLESYVKGNDYTRMINYIIKNYSFDSIITKLGDRSVIDDFISIMLYEISEYTTSLTDEDIEIMLDINNEIEKIQFYGHHNELVESGRSTVLKWSNSCECWNVSYFRELKKGNEITLDANEILVSYPKSKVNKYLCLLNELPLYKYSFEAGEERSHLITTLEWILKCMETDEYQKMREKYA